jgi:hypothetical protein
MSIEAQKLSGDSVASNDYKAWSLYGAPWWQTLATRRKSEGQKTAETSENRCRALRPLATWKGKEGVRGSSPREGFDEAPAQQSLSLPVMVTFRSGDVHETSTAPNVS